jgi:hypothetical protein
MKLFKTDSKGNFTVNVDGIEAETIITLLTTAENDNLPVMANATLKLVKPGNTKGGRITVQLTSCLTCLD